MKQIKQIIREVIPVIIGILIALVINNWNEDRKNENYLNQIFSSIEKELEQSNENIKQALPKQKALLDSIDVYLDDEAVSIIDLVLIGNGIQKPEIRNNSWRAIANSKIELVEYEQLAILSDIEERRANLYERIEKKSDFIFHNLQETNKEKKELLKLITIDIINAEKRLYYTIDEFIKK